MPEPEKMLRDMGEVAKLLTKEVPDRLVSPEWPVESARSMWEQTGKLADQAEVLIDLLDDKGANEGFVEAAEALQDIFLDLHTAIGTHLAEKRAL